MVRIAGRRMPMFIRLGNHMYKPPYQDADVVTSIA